MTKSTSWHLLVLPISLGILGWLRLVKLVHRATHFSWWLWYSTHVYNQWKNFFVSCCLQDLGTHSLKQSSSLILEMHSWARSIVWTQKSCQYILGGGGNPTKDLYCQSPLLVVSFFLQTICWSLFLESNYCTFKQTPWKKSYFLFSNRDQRRRQT